MNIAIATKDNFFGAYAYYLVCSLSYWNKQGEDSDVSVKLYTGCYTVYDAVNRFKQKDKNVDLYIVAGLDYTEGSLNFYGLNKWVNALSPSTKFIHVSEHGSELEPDKFKDVYSYVSDSKTSFVTLLWDAINDINFDGLEFTSPVDSRSVVDAVESYFQYKYGTDSFNAALDLRELYFSFRMLIGSSAPTSSVKGIQSYFAELLAYRSKYRQNRIKNILRHEVSCAKDSEISLCFYVFYTNEYENEVAHELMDRNEIGQHIVTFIVHPRSYKDLITVRTKNIPADKIVSFFGQGKGKGNDHAGYFYLKASGSNSLAEYLKRFTIQAMKG